MNVNNTLILTRQVLGPLVRLEMLSWSPLLDEYKDIEKMNWYSACMLYAGSADETEATLRLDPDVNLVPTIIEKIVLPKVAGKRPYRYI